MLYLFVVKVYKTFQNLLDIIADRSLREVPILRQYVGQTGLHLLQIDAEELAKELTSEEFDDVVVF